MKRNMHVGLLGVAMVATALLLPLQALADTTGGIGGKPAYPDSKNPRSESIFIHTIKRGETRSDAVFVVNNSDKKEIIDVYAVDSLVSNTGAFTCAQRVDEAKDVGSWIRIEKTQVTLSPGQKELVPFTITAPQTADVGEHNGCIVFQSTIDEGKLEGNVRIRTRQAIRFVATIPGQLKKDVSIQSYNFTSTSSEQTYKMMLANTGNVSADIEAGVRLRTLFGQEVYKNGGEYPILSNKSLQLIYTNPVASFPRKGVNYSFSLAFYEIFGGWYKTDASLTYDVRPGVFGLNDASKLVTKNAGETIIFVSPSKLGWIIIGVFGAILLASLATYGYLRRARIKLLKGWEAIEVQIDEDVVTIAKYYGIDWKKLARINKIKAPYIVREGQTIQVPIKRTATKVAEPKSATKKAAKKKASKK